MTAINHAATGALVAVIVNEPLLAIPAAFASHFAIDSLPHWDYKVPGNLFVRKTVIATDLAFSLIFLALLGFLIFPHTWLVIMGGLVAISPDAMWLPHIIKGTKMPTKPNNLLNKTRKIHSKIQWSESKNGRYFEMVWLILILSVLLALA